MIITQIHSDPSTHLIPVRRQSLEIICLRGREPKSLHVKGGLTFLLISFAALASGDRGCYCSSRVHPSSTLQQSPLPCPRRLPTANSLLHTSCCLGGPQINMLSQGLRRFAASGRHVQTRNFSRTAPANKIITSAPLRAKEVSPMIGNKYPIIDHEYDAVVVGAGGSGRWTP